MVASGRDLGTDILLVNGIIINIEELIYFAK